MKCVFIRVQGDNYRCQNCGFEVVSKHGPDRLCRICGASRRGLGDVVALALAKFGITKQRAGAWWAWWGSQPRVAGGFVCTWEIPCEAAPAANCGCVSRQQRLNRWGWTWQHRLNLLHWWIRLRVIYARDTLTRPFRCRS